MSLINFQVSELNVQLRSLLLETGFPYSLNQINNYFLISYQECFNRLQKAAISEGLIDYSVRKISISSYLEVLKVYSKQKSDFKYWHSLQEELNESITNQALALAYQDQWDKTIIQQAKNHTTLWSWLEQFNPHQLLNFLEQWGCAGHPCHPNFRAKMGFNRKEIIQYSPEFNSEVALCWAALHESLAWVSISKISYHCLFNNHFPKEYGLWCKALQLKHLNPDDYYPLPVHPWQWSNKLEKLVKRLLHNNQFVISSVYQQTKPSMSFRTMMPLTTHSPHLKLAVGVHTTSSLRTVYPASVDNSSRLSQWMTNLLAQNQYYKE